MLGALRRDDADLGEMTTYAIEQLRALRHQHVARAMAHQLRLVLHAAQRHEPHVRPRRRLADRRRVGRVVLVAPHIGFYVSWRDQLDRKAERREGAAPVMRRRARLHRNETARKRDRMTTYDFEGESHLVSTR